MTLPRTPVTGCILLFPFTRLITPHNKWQRQRHPQTCQTNTQKQPPRVAELFITPANFIAFRRTSRRASPPPSVDINISRSFTPLTSRRGLIYSTKSVRPLGGGGAAAGMGRRVGRMGGASAQEAPGEERRDDIKHV